jgi:hypothetical protein
MFLVSPLLAYSETRPKSKEVLYYKDIFQFGQIRTNNNYVVRLQINNKIKSLSINNVVLFYNNFTHSSYISRLIIQQCLIQKVPVNVAFALAWNESKFYYKAVSAINRNGSRDWGLFQLNDYVYKWKVSDFFNINKNITAGVSHLKQCLENNTNVQMALTEYNAGMRTIINNNIPNSTREYVKNILELEDTLNKDFNAKFG